MPAVHRVAEEEDDDEGAASMTPAQASLLETLDEYIAQQRKERAMKYSDKLRKAADVMDKLQLEPEYQIATDRYAVPIGQFRHAFKGCVVNRKPREEGWTYIAVKDGIAFEADEPCPLEPMEEVTL